MAIKVFTVDELVGCAMALRGDAQRDYLTALLSKAAEEQAELHRLRKIEASVLEWLDPTFSTDEEEAAHNERFGKVPA